MKGKLQPKLILNWKAVVANKVKSVMGVSSVMWVKSEKTTSIFEICNWDCLCNGTSNWNDIAMIQKKTTVSVETEKKYVIQVENEMKFAQKHQTR